MIGDWVKYTWNNGQDVANAVNFQRLYDKIYELDKYSIIRYVKKESDEYVNNTSALQDDDELSISLEANKVFEIEVNVITSALTSSGIKFAYTASKGINLLSKRFVDSPSMAGALYTYQAKMTARAIDSFYSSTNAYYSNYCHEIFLAETVTSGTSGTFKFQWAQSIAEPSNTYVRAGSFIKAMVVRPLV